MVQKRVNGSSEPQKPEVIVVMKSLITDNDDDDGPTDSCWRAVLEMCHASGVAGSGSVRKVSRMWCC